jgi:hypothetical protein
VPSLPPSLLSVELIAVAHPALLNRHGAVAVTVGGREGGREGGKEE